jgi:hypothetical protein
VKLVECIWVKEPQGDYDVIDNKHDKGYKYLLSAKKIFIELLRTFVKQGWVEKIDESKVARVDKSFILQDFKDKEADLVYWVKLNDQDVIFYILMEMQSTVDFQMPFRLLLYMVEIWRGILKDTSGGYEKTKGFKFNNISNGSDLKIYLPEREFNSIKIDTVSSNISSKSLNTEILTLITISGDIALSGEFPEIYLKTVSGNLQAEELDVQRITLETTSGEISLTGSLTELDINTISGDAKIYSSSMIKNIKSNAVSGNVTIAIPDNDGFTVDFSKVSGKLKSGFALTTNGNTHIYKNGKTKFSANSVSGNFEIIKNQ